MAHIYSILLVSLVGTLFVSPLASAIGYSGDLVELFLLINLVTAAFGAQVKEERMRLLLILGFAGALRLAGTLYKSELTASVAALIWIVLAGKAAFKALRFAMSAKSVDVEHICAALSVYMLAGHFYGLAYWKIESIWPGSFTLSESARTAGLMDLPSAIYLSFVTVATVGFGDIVPRSPVSRGLVVTEAVLGQFYMVVLVTRLVSLYSNRENFKEQ